MKATVGLLVTWLIAFACWASDGHAQKLGRFDGELVLKVLPNGRDMELLRPFSYLDSHDISWPVPAGTRVDGASIPTVFWSLIGAPYTGKYREASVIHDYYCAAKSRHWKAVHKVFLDGMLARGVDKAQAQLMYLAVYRFGPLGLRCGRLLLQGLPRLREPHLEARRQIPVALQGGGIRGTAQQAAGWAPLAPGA